MFKKLFRKREKFSLDSSDDPFKDMEGGSSDSTFSSSDPLSHSTREEYGHGTLTTSKEFTPIGSSTMNSSLGEHTGYSGGDTHVQDIMQKDMQIINAKLDAIKANVEILSHKIESLEKATTEKKKNTYW